jgi:hypothetical protein
MISSALWTRFAALKAQGEGERVGKVAPVCVGHRYH